MVRIGDHLINLDRVAGLSIRNYEDPASGLVVRSELTIHYPASTEVVLDASRTRAEAVLIWLGDRLPILVTEME